MLGKHPRLLNVPQKIVDDDDLMGFGY